MILDFGGNLEDKFGKPEIITGPMASGKTTFALTITTIYRHFANELNCRILLFRPNIDTRPDMSRLGIERDKEFVRVEKAEDILKYAKDKRKFGKRNVDFIDEPEFLDSKTIEVIEELARIGDYPLLSALTTNFRGEPFAFKDYKKTMEDLLKIIPEQNKHVSRMAKCRVCRKTAEYTQRLLNGEPAPYYDPLVRVDSEKDIAQADKKYSYEPRCQEHFYVPGKDEYKFVAFLLKQNHGLKLEEATEIARQTGKIPADITMQIIETMCAEKQAHFDGQKIYAPPVIQIAKEMPQ